MEANKDTMIKIMGAEKYKEECEILTKMKEKAVKSGAFQAVEGDVDTR